MIWTGLRQELKDISGYKYELTKDFNQLKVALRQLEKDHQPKKSKPNTSKAITETNTYKKEMDELRGMVQQLSTQVTEMQQQQTQYYRGNNYRGKSYRGNRGKGGKWNYQKQQTNSSQPQQQEQSDNQQSTYQHKPIVCQRCGQEGHIQIGCRVRLDHSRQHLNSRKPMQRGRY